jgi:hypothetical protein
LSDWQLDRLPEEVRQNAESAAQRDGLPLHRWLGKLIRETCAEEGVPLSRELSAIASHEPLANRRDLAAAVAPPPAVEPIIVVPDAAGTERLPVAERPAAAAHNGFARDGRGNDAAKTVAIRVLGSSEPRRQTSSQWRQTRPLARDSMPPATGPITPPAHRPSAQASTIGSAAPAAALPAASPAMPPIVTKPLVTLEHRFARKPPPAPPQERAAAATAPPVPTISFPLATSGSHDRIALLSTLVRRLRRNELSPIAEAGLFQKLIGEQTASISDIALATGRTEEQVARSLRLLTLPDKERDMIDRGALSRAAAFQLLQKGVLDPATSIVPAGTRTP